MKLSLDDLFTLVSIYSNYRAKSITLADAIKQAVAIPDVAALTLGEAATIAAKFGIAL